MKNLILTIIVVFISMNSAVSQTAWQVLNSGVSVNLYGVSFININTGIVCGAGGTILKTTNAGHNWHQLNSAVTYQLNDICFSDINTWYCCGASGVIKTTNGGENWVSVFNLPTFKITYVDSLLFTITQTNLYKSTNAGQNWESIFYQPGNLKGLFFNNRDTGYVMGGNAGTQKKTTNGGLNWYPGAPWFPGEYTFGECYFFNSDTGCVCSTYMSGFPNYNTSYGIYQATLLGSGGSSWHMVYSSNIMAVAALTFSGKDTGYAVGGTQIYSVYRSLIIKTTNKGTTWDSLSFSVNQILSDVTFLTSKYGYAVGRMGTIIKTETGGITKVTLGSEETPSVYWLSQNYPNPFNSTSNLKFEIAKLSSVRIVVYDVLGREVQVLVNEVLQPGIHRATFDASMLSSGVYFYRMDAGDFIDVKRFVVLK